jgi:L-histidine Nalpha-methyltransferase
LNPINLLPPGFLENALREDVRAGLAAMPKALPSKWLHDAWGSSLFAKIAELPEYYLARAEHAILGDVAGTVAALTGANALIELGPGAPEQTRLLLDALREWGTIEAYVGVDVNECAVRATGDALEARYPGLVVRPVVADFEEHLGLPGYPATGRRLVAFLGPAFGKMVPARRALFLARVRSRLHEGDAFLLSTDLVKDPDVLVGAYDDSAGVTAAYDKNVLAVLNARLGADFDPDSFDHIAMWVPEMEWIETRLRSVPSQQVRVPGAGLTARFRAGEEMRTEISAKFRRDRLTSELAAAGLAIHTWWTDPADQFAVSLSVPA